MTPTPSTQPLDRIAVIGAGAWGTALASAARHAGRDVTQWGRDAGVIDAIRMTARNMAYLPDIPLAAGIRATTDLATCLAGAQAVLLVTPSPSLRAVCATLRPHLPPGIPVTLCAKGIERDTGLLLSDGVGADLPGHPIGALSGPTFAHEVARGFPTAVTIAFPFTTQDRLTPGDTPAARLAVSLRSTTLRPYITDDLVGVEVGGAVKNVIAIACGMMTGAGFAENTRAALFTRGLGEMTALATALGGRAETIMGLSGAGDLTLTCSSQTSRNMSLGVQLGQGIARAACFGGRPVVVEGEVNAASVTTLAARVGVPMPICQAVNAILHHQADLKATFTEMWNRPLRSEGASLDISLVNPGTALGRDRLEP